MTLNDFVRGKPKIAETVHLLVLRSTEIDSQLESNPETTLGLIPGTLKMIRVALHKVRGMGFKEAVIVTDHGFFLNAQAEAGDVCVKPQGTWPVNAHDRMMLGTGSADGHSLVASAEKVGIRGDFAQVYREANLAVRRRKKTRRPISERLPFRPADAPNAVWSMDFVSDALANGRRLKCLTVADDFSHECVDIPVDHGISGAYVVRLLDQAACFRGYPRAVRTDNGPEFTSRAFIAWTQQHGIEHLLIQPGRPMQNGDIERFNGKFRDE